MKEEKAARTREDINRKISELREPMASVPPCPFDDVFLEPYPSSDGNWFWFSIYSIESDTPKLYPKDWHVDANWPTLLREAGIYVGPASSGFGWSACHRKNGEFTRFVLAEDVAEVVCLAWLKWKESQ